MFYSGNPPPDRRHVFRDAKYARQTFPGRWYACPAGVCRFTLEIRRRIGGMYDTDSAAACRTFQGCLQAAQVTVQQS